MTAAKMERTRRAVVKDFGDVLAEAETLLKQAASETGERASDLRSQVESKLLAAKLKASPRTCRFGWVVNGQIRAIRSLQV